MLSGSSTNRMSKRQYDGPWLSARPGCPLGRSLGPVSGIEGAAAAGAGKAIAKLAGKAMEEDPKDQEVLRRIAEGKGELDPAARARARRLAVKEHIRLKLWQPLARLFDVPSDYFQFQFEDDMADRLSDVPEEDWVLPRGSIAGPAIQGLGFTVEEPELREMYLNLLATASDTRVARSAHPSFADVIRQLTAEEARDLPDVVATGDIKTHPIVEIRRQSIGPDEGGGYIPLATHVLNWHENDQPIAAPERALWVDNWIRLGLVTVDYGAKLTQEERYSWVETTPLLVEARKQHDTAELKRIEYQLGVLRVTDFGQAFARVVIRTSTPVAQLDAESAGAGRCAPDP
jgi:hypothetical protein